MTDDTVLRGRHHDAAGLVDAGGGRRIAVSPGLMRASDAAFSPCGSYRYFLSRQWARGPRVLWILLNPSTAELGYNDSTVHRCQKYTAHWGYSGYMVCNIFAIRATDPAWLKRVEDPVGPDNDATIAAAIERIHGEGGIVVCGWGGHGRVRWRGRAVKALLRDTGVAVHALAWNKGGGPSHPLFLKGDLTPQAWSLAPA